MHGERFTKLTTRILNVLNKKTREIYVLVVSYMQVEMFKKSEVQTHSDPIRKKIRKIRPDLARPRALNLLLISTT